MIGWQDFHLFILLMGEQENNKNKIALQYYINIHKTNASLMICFRMLLKCYYAQFITQSVPWSVQCESEDHSRWIPFHQHGMTLNNNNNNNKE